MKMQYLKFGLLIVFFTIILFLVYYFDLTQYTSIALLKDKINSFGYWAPLVLILFYIVNVAFFLPFGLPLDLVAGALFGLFWGTLYVVVGATIGSIIAFTIARILGRPFVESVLENRMKKLERYDEKLQESGFKWVFLLRVVPVIPFNILNLVFGLTGVSYRNFIFGTFLGIIPGVLNYIYFTSSVINASMANVMTSILFLLLLIMIFPLINCFKDLNRNEFDLIVIGAGSGGLHLAKAMNKAGFKVLLIDRSERNIGGDSLVYGCVPSKTLIHIARKLHGAHYLKRFGLKLQDHLQIAEVMSFIKERQDVFRSIDNVQSLKEQGLYVELGEAEFSGEDEVKVNNKKYHSRKIVLATGSKPRIPQIPGIDKVAYYTNENIFDIDFLPKNLLVIGGGPIGIELGQAFQYLGSKVTVVHSGEMILGKEDQEIAQVLYDDLVKLGMQFHLSSHLNRFESANNAEIVDKNKHTKYYLNFDAVLLAMGRELDIDTLHLEKAGVEVEYGKIKVDKYLRTTNKDILLCGDIVGSYQFTHAAELHSAIILHNFTSLIKRSVSYDNFAWTTFTYPEIATFGMSEADIIAAEIDYKVLQDDFLQDDRAIIDEYPRSLIKLFISGDQILGGTIIAPGAGELIQELILAQHHNIKTSDIFAKTYPYPVASRINKKVIGQLYDQKERTDFEKKVLRLFFN